MANNNGKTAQNTRVIGLRIKWKDKDFIIWSMAELTVECGRIINFMEKAYNKPLMVENMTEILQKESNMDMDFILGEMVNNMMDNGNKENNTEKVLLQLQLDKFVEEFGLMA